MVGTRPLLYFSLPGLALIIGFIFLRRQKKSRDEEGDKRNEPDNNSKAVTFNNESVKKRMNNNHHNNINIENNGGITIKNKNSYYEEDRIEFETKLGKSAPINIAHGGGKSLTSKYLNDDNNDDDDDDQLEYNNHNRYSLIDKDDDDSYLSSLDLPDSPNNRKRYTTVHCNDIKNSEEPIIVRATVTPNISLSSSFIENEYTSEESDPVIESPRQQQQQQQQQHQLQQQQQQQEEEEDEKSNDDDNNVLKTITEDHPLTDITTDITTIATTITPTTTTTNVQSLSPPISEFSAHSGDSGKGSSLPQSERLKITNYDFLLPISLIGRLCGRRHSYLNQIKTKSGSNIILKNHLSMNNMKICSIKGTEKEINNALSLIRLRFPIKRYPHLTLQKIEYAEPQKIVQLSLDYTSCLQLRLIEGINNDIIVVSVLSGNHIFVHNPSHPSFPSINVLHDFMNKSYEIGNAPLLPELCENAICVGKCGNLWYRVQIVTKNLKEQNCLVKFLDYGGYTIIDVDNLRQIRADFMTMPFQATECILSNVEPIGSEWSHEAIETLCHLTAGLVLQAQIVRYNSSNIPEINLYAPLSKNSVIFINKEMVARGFAK